MMQHYLEVKGENPDAYLFYRLGDFYEMFFDDAREVSKLLDITLTGRDCGLSEKAPMCGVPHQTVEVYISRLVKLGKKVAVCDQLSTPQDGKGILKRGVVRVITPGTVNEDAMLEAGTNNYLLSIYFDKNEAGFAWVDVSTGDMNVMEVSNKSKDSLEDFVLSIRPSEIIAHSSTVAIVSEFNSVKTANCVKPTEFYDYSYIPDNAQKTILRFYKINNLFALGIENNSAIISALGGLLKYVEETQKKSLAHIRAPKVIRSKTRMFLDYNTQKNLELLETLSDKKVKGSLLGVLDSTRTNMGLRLLKKWITEPLMNSAVINYRLDAVEELTRNETTRFELSNILGKMRDVERLCSKIAYNTINPRECESIAVSIGVVKPIIEMLTAMKSKYLVNIKNDLDALPYLVNLLYNAIVENPSISLKDGGVIKQGFNEKLDAYRNSQKNGKSELAKYEAYEKERTGIKTLKVGYSRAFGYYIEISNGQANRAPARYMRKQTLTNSERFMTNELSDLEELILGAEEKALKLEEQLYAEIKKELTNNLDALLNNARLLSEIDVLCSLSNVACNNGYVRPIISDDIRALKINEGRHPVVESLLKGMPFVPNDTLINDDTRTIIVTGPNMAGKSTYMRQVALIVLLSHMGSFVPAKRAEIPITDRIFTRIGASDNLAYGQSTFMLEMTEVANIINNASQNSLLILDEIGRGTSFSDGLSIACALIEYITLKIKAKTLFATHYHELGELEDSIDAIKNIHILIKEDKDEIIFLYKLVPGITSRSFGIEVAQLAGVEKSIIDRSKKIMKKLENTITQAGSLKDSIGLSDFDDEPVRQASLFEEDFATKEIIGTIQSLNLNDYTPIQALTLLSELVEKTKSIPKKK
jgi:DNA mismatch repair protein MutS